MSDTTTQNVLLYCGSMAVLATFWLAMLGLGNRSAPQLAGAAIFLFAALACFRGYNTAVHREKARLEAED